MVRNLHFRHNSSQSLLNWGVGKMKIGVIGAGRIGGTLAKLWAKKGHQIVISSSHPDKLDSLVKTIGSQCCSGTFEDAAKFGEIVLLAIPLGGIVAVSAKIKSHLTNKIVLDAMNPFTERDGEIALDIINRKIASGQATQERFPSSRIVRAFSSIKYSDLQEHSNQTPAIAVPYSTDFTDAKHIAEQLIYDAGFIPFDLGPLNHSKSIDPGGILFGKALSEKHIIELLMH